VTAANPKEPVAEPTEPSPQPVAAVPVPAPRPARLRLLRRFLLSDTPASSESSGAESPEQTWPWTKVLWLTGVDYFSTLGYQPGIAFLAAGALSPVASALLVLVTLAGALPAYMAVARRSYIGQGSIAMLEKLLPGWWSKLFVLLLLGFASTAFVITMTLSAADAALHAVENPLLNPVLGGHRMAVTLVLLALLAALFLKGAREVIGVAVAVGIPYILANVVVIGRGLWEVAARPDLWHHFSLQLSAHGDPIAILFASILVFPKLALGLSGFETGVSVMPLVRSEPAPGEDAVGGRVRATRKLLAAAALIMSVMLIGSSLATTVLIPARAFQPGGAANGRALAYLAHSLMGDGFGTVYDLLTIVILWFAGASAMAGLLNIIPRYLPRFGMAPQWLLHSRPLVLLLFGADVLVTIAFGAEVDAQGGAYATGVLVMILSAAVAVAIATWHEARAHKLKHLPWASLFFWAISAIFAFALIDNVITRPDGVIISGIFCLIVLAASGASRFLRSTELRVEKLSFVDAESERRWETLKNKKVNLVPLRTASPRARQAKAAEIRRYYQTHGPIAFLHINLRDDRSEFSSALRVRIESADDAGEGCVVVHISGAVATANAIAYVSEQLDPIALFLGLTLGNKMTQAIKYLLWGEGEVGVLVYEILVRYWEWTPEDDVRPLIFLMSE
jgi:hypothetical protein